MRINWSRAIIGGLCGVVVVLGIVGLAGYVTGSGSEADLCRIAGIIVTGRADAIGWIVGCAVQLAVAIVAALCYAVIFEWVTRRSGALIGSALGVAHAMIAGIAVGFVPASSLIDHAVLPPGAFYEYRGGWMVAAFIVAHVLFGIIVGSAYGKLKRPLPPATRRWQEIQLPTVARAPSGSTDAE